MHTTDNTPRYQTMDRDDNPHSIPGESGDTRNSIIPSVEAQYERAAWFRTTASAERRPSAETALLPEGERLSSSSDKCQVKRRSTLLHVTGFIIVTEFCERLAYYGFAGSLVLLFQTQLGMANAEADTQYAVWAGVCYVTPLLGGWVADSYLGRYNSILLFSSVYLVGLFVAAGSCVPGRVSPALLFPAIYLLALGTGGIKSSVSVFGADQFDDSDPRDAKEKQSFFNWFYWSINLGALVSYTVVSYVCQNGLPFLGGRDWGFMAGYSIPSFSMAIAVAVFIAGTPRYRRLPATGSVLGRAAGIVSEAAKKTACKNITRTKVAGGVTAGGGSSSNRGAYGVIGDGIANNGHGNGSGSGAMDNDYDDTEGTGSVQGGGGRGGGGGEAGMGGRRRPRWLQRASQKENGSYPDDEVADVSRVWKLLPFLALQVPYWAVYAQMSTAFQNQGCQMQLSVGDFEVPVAALNMFDTLSILLLIPLVDRGVYPWLQRRGWEPTMLRKIGAGLLLAGCAVAVAAGVEVLRRRSVGDGDGAQLSPCRRERDYDPAQFQDYWKTRGRSTPAYRPNYCNHIHGCDEVGPDGLLDLSCIHCDAPPVTSDLNVLWQIPQYLLIGASEILASVTSLEFFYAEAPTTMRGVSAGLNLLTTALGSWITVPLLNLVNSGAFGGAWVPDDLNNGHLEFYFLLLAGLVVVSLLCFLVVSTGYTYQSLDATASPAGSASSAATARTTNLLSCESDDDDGSDACDMEGGQDDDHGMDAMRGTLGAEEGMVRLSGAVQGGNGGGDGTMAVQWKGDSVILQPHQQQRQRQDHSGGPSAFGRI